MAAGGEAEYAYARGVNAPLGRARAHGAQRPRRVLKHRRVVVARPYSVLEHEGRDAQSVEPLGDGPPLVIREVLVAAAGADDDGRAGRLILGRQVDRKFRLVGRPRALGARSALGPE